MLVRLSESSGEVRKDIKNSNGNPKYGYFYSDAAAIESGLIVCLSDKDLSSYFWHVTSVWWPRFQSWKKYQASLEEAATLNFSFIHVAVCNCIAYIHMCTLERDLIVEWVLLIYMICRVRLIKQPHNLRTYLTLHKVYINSYTWLWTWWRGWVWYIHSRHFYCKA